MKDFKFKFSDFISEKDLKQLNQQRQPKGQNNGKTERTPLSESKRVTTPSRDAQIQS